MFATSRASRSLGNSTHAALSPVFGQATTLCVVKPLSTMSMIRLSVEIMHTTSRFDLARYLVGEIATVFAIVRTFVPGRRVDDSVHAAVEFEGGAAGTVEATRLALGRRNSLRFELNGERASLALDLERMNELEVFRADGDRARGFKTVLVSEAEHPFWRWWWPPGHIIGWEHTFVHEIHHLLAAIAGEGEVAPHGATFEDGYRAAEVCDAFVRSSESDRREQVAYRT
jgi:predicted dehydrogenase